MSLESSRARRLQLKVEAGDMGGASRLVDLTGARSGSILPAEMVSERLLGTVSQLAQFGLAPTSPPLLKPVSDDFFTAILNYTEQ
jgi:hypothetical protein